MKFWTIDEIKRANERAGFYFFSDQTMRFFKSRALSDVFHGPCGIFFVTSDAAGFHGGRLYNVRQFIEETGNVKTRDEHTKFASRTLALRVAREAAEDASRDEWGYWVTSALNDADFLERTKRLEPGAVEKLRASTRAYLEGLQAKNAKNREKRRAKEGREV